jgi:hypothetical protein
MMQENADELSSARGLLISVLISVIFWCLIGMLFILIHYLKLKQEGVRSYPTLTKLYQYMQQF